MESSESGVVLIEDELFPLFEEVADKFGVVGADGVVDAVFADGVLGLKEFVVGDFELLVFFLVEFEQNLEGIQISL